MLKRAMRIPFNFFSREPVPLSPGGVGVVTVVVLSVVVSPSLVLVEFGVNSVVGVVVVVGIVVGSPLKSRASTLTESIIINDPFKLLPTTS
jgi:hypothetical protein